METLLAPLGIRVPTADDPPDTPVTIDAAPHVIKARAFEHIAQSAPAWIGLRVNAEETPIYLALEDYVSAHQDHRPDLVRALVAPAAHLVVPTSQNTTHSDADRTTTTDSLLKLLLDTDTLQLAVAHFIANVLFFTFDTSDAATVAFVRSRALQALQWLEYVPAPTALASAMTRALENCDSADFERDVLSALPEIVPESAHESIADVLLGLGDAAGAGAATKDYLADRELAGAAVQCLSGLSLSPNRSDAAVEKILGLLGLATAAVIPLFVRYLLDRAATLPAADQAGALVARLFDALDLRDLELTKSNGKTAGADTSANAQSVIVSIMGEIRAALRRTKALYAATLAWANRMHTDLVQAAATANATSAFGGTDRAHAKPPLPLSDREWIVLASTASVSLAAAKDVSKHLMRVIAAQRLSPMHVAALAERFAGPLESVHGQMLAIAETLVKPPVVFGRMAGSGGTAGVTSANAASSNSTGGTGREGSRSAFDTVIGDATPLLMRCGLTLVGLDPDAQVPVISPAMSVGAQLYFAMIKHTMSPVVRQEWLASVVSLAGSAAVAGGAQTEIALAILLAIGRDADARASVRPLLVFVRNLLDFLDGLSLRHVGQYFAVLAQFGYSDPIAESAVDWDSAIETRQMVVDLTLWVRKTLDKARARTNAVGVLAQAAMVGRLAAADSPWVQSPELSAHAHERAVDAIMETMERFLVKPQVAAVLYDQLAGLITRGTRPACRIGASTALAARNGRGRAYIFHAFVHRVVSLLSEWFPAVQVAGTSYNPSTTTSIGTTSSAATAAEMQRQQGTMYVVGTGGVAPVTESDVATVEDRAAEFMTFFTVHSVNAPAIVRILLACHRLLTEDGGDTAAANADSSVLSPMALVQRPIVFYRGYAMTVLAYVRLLATYDAGLPLDEVIAHVQHMFQLHCMVEEDLASRPAPTAAAPAAAPVKDQVVAGGDDDDSQNEPVPVVKGKGKGKAKAKATPAATGSGRKSRLSAGNSPDPDPNPDQSRLAKTWLPAMRSQWPLTPSVFLAMPRIPKSDRPLFHYLLSEFYAQLLRPSSTMEVHNSLTTDNNPTSSSDPDLVLPSDTATLPVPIDLGTTLMQCWAEWLVHLGREHAGESDVRAHHDETMDVDVDDAASDMVSVIGTTVGDGASDKQQQQPRLAALGSATRAKAAAARSTTASAEETLDLILSCMLHLLKLPPASVNARNSGGAGACTQAANPAADLTTALLQALAQQIDKLQAEDGESMMDCDDDPNQGDSSMALDGNNDKNDRFDRAILQILGFLGSIINMWSPVTAILVFDVMKQVAMAQAAVIARRRRHEEESSLPASSFSVALSAAMLPVASSAAPPSRTRGHPSLGSTSAAMVIPPEYRASLHSAARAFLSLPLSRFSGIEKRQEPLEFFIEADLEFADDPIDRVRHLITLMVCTTWEVTANERQKDVLHRSIADVWPSADEIEGEPLLTTTTLRAYFKVCLKLLSQLLSQHFSSPLAMDVDNLTGICEQFTVCLQLVTVYCDKLPFLRSALAVGIRFVTLIGAQVLPALTARPGCTLQDVQRVAQAVQTGSRILQRVCVQSKVMGNKSLLTQVPKARKVLEEYIQAVKQAAVAVGAGHAIQTARMKHVALDGAPAASQYAPVEFSSDEEEEENKEDEESAVPVAGKRKRGAAATGAAAATPARKRARTSASASGTGTAKGKATAPKPPAPVAPTSAKKSVTMVVPARGFDGNNDDDRDGDGNSSTDPGVDDDDDDDTQVAVELQLGDDDDEDEEDDDGSVPHFALSQVAQRQQMQQPVASRAAAGVSVISSDDDDEEDDAEVEDPSSTPRLHMPPPPTVARPYSLGSATATAAARVPLSQAGRSVSASSLGGMAGASQRIAGGGLSRSGSAGFRPPVRPR
ncbi:hypothetical protein BC828DRAFT_383063 [Blastocladiella britannica]|nr:hypothetical protein BC828DRAFT_383063 [Blastocladiella britannica]